MRTKPFQCVLSFLALLGTVHGSIAECTAQAWVRAPDLTPNAIIHGDARVKISAECPAVDDVSLGVRFKERSFVKVLRSRENAKWLNPPPLMYNLSNTSPWTSPSRFPNKSAEEAYEEITTDKGLWIVKEEERLVFETTRPVNMGNGNHGALRDVVQDFSIFLPSTNFPAALDVRGGGFSLAMDREIAYVEWIYEYFAHISYSDGTTKEVSAGFTAFQPLHDLSYTSQGVISAAAELKPMFGNARDNIANYSIEISDDSGLTFFPGTKSHVVTAVVTRTGFPRTFSAPLRVYLCIMSDQSSKWAAEYDLSGINAIHDSRPTFVLRATSDSDRRRVRLRCPYQPNSGITVIMPNSTSEEIQANEIVTTASAAFTVSIDVDDAHVPTFETYYQSLANSLTIRVETIQGEDEAVDPDDPSGERSVSMGLQFEDDEEAWVPWEKKGSGRNPWRSYSGDVPAVVHPTMQVVMSDETACEEHSLIHYLEEGARGPTFVDRNVIDELLAEDPAERERRAPILEPVVFSIPKGEELIYRYHLPAIPRKLPIYVGETWAKKVANKNNVSSAMSGSSPIVSHAEAVEHVVRMP